MPNRLINETSPYLLQHAHNPVDWYAWGPEAIERASKEEKLILLSIGYSACHWCHVMEHESFEDNETTLEQVYSRIDSAIDYIKTFKPEQIDGSEGRTIVLKMRSGEMTFEGQAYLLGFVLPNVFFHCTTAYNILREAGTEIGKMDFIGQA